MDRAFLFISQKDRPEDTFIETLKGLNPLPQAILWDPEQLKPNDVFEFRHPRACIYLTAKYTPLDLRGLRA